MATYEIVVKDNLFYKRWTPIFQRRYSTKPKAKSALESYLKDMPHLKKKHFKIREYKADRRFR